MAKLILKFDNRVLKECEVGSHPVVIGRIPNNHLVIDNPAVSSHHARVFHDGAAIIVEDLRSTNGTFVNDRPVARHELHDGDVLSIGKHQVIFSEFDPASADPATDVDFGGTMMLDTRQQRQRLARSGVNPFQAPRAAAPASPAPAKPVGMLKVLAGRVDRTEYTLAATTSIIGRCDSALVRLKGWFKPKMALVIARKGDRYSATPVGGRTRINGRRIDARFDLKDGDVLEVGGVRLEFRSVASREPAASAKPVQRIAQAM